MEKESAFFTGMPGSKDRMTRRERMEALMRIRKSTIQDLDRMTELLPLLM